MKYCDGSSRGLASVQDKGELRTVLADRNWSFTKEELDAIIRNEFFDDANPLDIELVDLVVTRTLLLKGIQPNDDLLQKEQEKMISDVLRELLKFNK